MRRWTAHDYVERGACYAGTSSVWLAVLDAAYSDSVSAPRRIHRRALRDDFDLRHRDARGDHLSLFPIHPSPTNIYRAAHVGGCCLRAAIDCVDFSCMGGR